MKRWQDRGEVLDSDEEDLLITAESQSQEIPRKRAKIHHEGAGSGEGPRGGRKNLSTTEGSKQDDSNDASATVQGSPGAAETEVVGGDTGPAVSKSMTEGKARTDHEDPVQTTQKPVATYSRRGKLPSFGLISRELVPVVSQLERGAVQSEELSIFLAASSPAVSPEDTWFSQDNSRSSQAPAEPSSTPPTSEQQPVGDPLSRASSPLSELSDPPDSPPPCVDLFQSRQGPASCAEQENVAQIQDPGVNQVSNQVSPSGSDQAQYVDLLSTQGPTRRSLRARQEKQLHPYMYDKALYQRQCRERGMKPITLAEQRANETQEASLSNGETQSHTGTQPMSSTTVPSSSFGSLSDTQGGPPVVAELANSSPGQRSSDDELPDFQALISRKTNKHGHEKKRRKLGHVPSRLDSAPDHHIEYDGNDFMVPPSPPSSTMGGATGKASRPLTAGFRLPRGLSPKTLPTPQISSEARLSHRFEVPLSSAESSPPRTLRRTPLSRHPITIISDDSSDKSESPISEVEDGRLLMERRRIKGVLPASWLKIDLKAQQRRVVAPAYESDDNLTPRATTPARGVARKVMSRHAPPSSRFVLDISDDEHTDRSAQSQMSEPRQQAPLRNTPHRPAADGSVLLDGDDMEVDWIDSMLAGSTRTSGQAGSRQKRHPRAKSSSSRHQTDVQNMSEEQNGLRGMHGRDSISRRQKAGRADNARKPRARPIKLSILDAPSSANASTVKLPQFVRLAARQARQATDNGRHSPSHKILRLATRADTEEANMPLRNWQRGMIKRSARPTRSTESRTVELGEADSDAVQAPREPLLDITNGRSEMGPLSPAHKLLPQYRHLLRQPYATQSSRQAGLEPATPRTAGSASARSDAGHAATPDHQQRTRKGVAPRVVRYRGAQLESLEDPHDHQSRLLAFERRVQCLTESVARKSGTRVDIGLPMARFLEIEPRQIHDETADTGRNQPNPATRRSNHVPAARPLALAHRSRKRQARRLDIDTREYRQPSEPLPDAISTDEFTSETIVESGPVLQGLGPVGTRYAVDFDIRPLPQGTFFHESTFIGSGDFAASLSFGKRDLDAGYGTLTVHINGTAHSWSAWTEEVSSAIAEIPSATTALLQILIGVREEDIVVQRAAVTSNVDHMLRSVVRYVSTCLRFHDQVDRTSCVQKLIRLVEDLTEVANDLTSLPDMCDPLRQRMLQYALVIARQARTICDSAFIFADVRVQCDAALQSSRSKLAGCLLPTKLSALRDAYETCRTASCREGGIRDDDSVIAGILILHHSTKATSTQQSPFWRIVSACLNLSIADEVRAPALDQAWYAMYSLLPALDFDVFGFANTPRDEALTEADWSLPKQIVERTLALYASSSAVLGSNVNEYVRATLRRCHHLVSKWRWWRCEPVLGTIYDFFARRGLRLLHKEDGKGSPDFLAHLAVGEDLDLQVQPGDCSFHIFLKLLTSTLRVLRDHGVYADKKIGGVAWRFIPNHARMYRKDAELKQTDLDALRNHCDLLSVLYFASPPSSRPGISLLQDLVDHPSSHREACRISVRAWANLSSFQTSAAEPASCIEPFAKWYKDMMHTTVSQYRLARTEAEQQYVEAQAQGVSDMTDDVLERTIASNQRQIAATLVDLLAAIKCAATSATSISIATVLVETCEPWKAFDTFSPSERRLLSVFREALDLTKALLDLQRKEKPAQESQHQSEDSQDYGDASIFQDFDDTDKESAYASNTTDVVHLIAEPLSHLVSNAFGSELSPDDTFLTQLVDVWVRLAAHAVRAGTRTWHNFVDDYSAGAWFQLRDTDQHSKYTPYLLARIVENNADATAQLKQTVLVTWLMSMVERESKLKYQHLLTTALLNTYDDEPMLENLPLIRLTILGKYQISLADFRQRRVAIISSVLSNMQEAYSNSVYGGAQSIAETRRTYSEMLRQLMQAMKTNYQELLVEHSTTSIDFQGAYVEFIQQVVSCLQQYTTDICPIDRFFTDSSAFPLPATDPAYVVGRLKSYAPKLYEGKTRKQLAVFVHTVAERAAVDGQQTYLVDQLFAAMSGTLEPGNSTSSTLRHVLLTAVLPAYVENALTSGCSWILALPILDASAKTAVRLLYDTNLGNEDSVSALVDQIDAVLLSCQRVVVYALERLGQLTLPHAQRTLAAIFNLCRSATTVTSFLQRSTDKGTAISRRLQTLYAQAKAIATYLSSPKDFYDLDMPYSILDAQSNGWPDTRSFSSKQFQDAMTQDWSVSDGKYYVRRGNAFKEVVVTRDDDEAKEDLLAAIRKFVRYWDLCQARGTGRVGGEGEEFGLTNLIV